LLTYPLAVLRTNLILKHPPVVLRTYLLLDDEVLPKNVLQIFLVQLFLQKNKFIEYQFYTFFFIKKKIKIKKKMIMKNFRKYKN
jgi:hypothetical protein